MRYCQQHKVPMLQGADGQAICPVEWFEEWFSDARIRDLVPENLDDGQGALIVLTNGETLPIDRFYYLIQGAFQLCLLSMDDLLKDLAGTALAYLLTMRRTFLETNLGRE